MTKHLTQNEQIRTAAFGLDQPPTFTNAEEVEVIDELLMVGVSADDILRGALAGTLALAEAGQMKTTDAADIVERVLRTPMEEAS